MKKNSMTITSLRDHRNSKGTKVFVYAVAGTAEQLAHFKQVQGKHYREDKDTGEPLFFSPRYAGELASLIYIESKHKFIPDMSSYEKAASIAEQFGGNFGVELARQLATGMASQITAPSSQSSSATEGEPPAAEKPKRGRKAKADQPLTDG